MIKLFLHTVAFSCCILFALIFGLGYMGSINIASCVISELILLIGLYRTVDLLKQYR